MEIVLKSNYALFTPFKFKLPNFTIITGKNGSGKTLLLKGIKSLIIDNDITDPNADILINEAAIKYISNSSFNVQQQQLSKDNPGKQYDIYQRSQMLKNHPKRFDESEKKYLEKIVNIIAKTAGKDKEELIESDFLKFTPVNASNSEGGIFNLDFFWECLDYAMKMDNNLYNEFLNTKGKKDISFYTQEEFIDSYGEAPWNSINKIFNSMKIEYEIETSDISNLDNFRVFFVHKESREKVEFNSLSSGEQVIALTAFSMLNIDSNLRTPKILLMDEPDASLHPSMIKDFLRAIEDIFVKEKGIKVILTTHNPTTVALAPEESLHAMIRTADVIQKVTKDTALKILTEGVPSFSVNYENRRQVFVESDNDVKYYDRFYTILKNKLHQDISLNFISSGIGPNDKNGMPTSNCEQVLKVTTTLRVNGNNSAWGIIDWDRKEHKHDLSLVKILGNKKRYSIENYIFDPIAVAAFLLRKEIISNEDLNMEPNEDITNFATFTNEKLQEISDIIVNKIAPFRDNAEKIGKYIANDQTVQNVLIDGRQYDIPLWVNELRGHLLEDEVYIKAFPELEKIKNKKEDRLKLFIINEVFAAIPEIIPVDIIDLFNELQAL